MQSKKVKIICFSVNGSHAKEFELSWSRLYSLAAGLFLVLLTIVALTVGVFTDFYHNIENASLSKLNTILQSQLTQMGSKVSHIQAKIDVLETNDDRLRLIADLPEIDSDTRKVGVGGYLDEVSYTAPLNGSPIIEKLDDYQKILDKVERQVDLTKASQEEISNKLVENQKIVKHLPSIRPTIDGTIKDAFGFRRHPILDKIKHHPGIDISSPRGTEVFATAAGVVEKVVTKYKINKSWGKYVIINHGSGLKTLYGHLSKVLVKKGQKVDRWKPVGLVGETGMATGPHLHYEVIKDGKRENPLKFILNDTVF
ncbi:M23 family metallopeptidase [bacterium]|nr:M23 family metallopeptidase [bacterium]